MLVLTLRLDEKVFIGNDIIVQLVAWSGTDGIKLGFTAPDDVAIDRYKVRKSKEATNYEGDVQTWDGRIRNRRDQRS